MLSYQRELKTDVCQRFITIVIFFLDLCDRSAEFSHGVLLLFCCCYSSRNSTLDALHIAYVTPNEPRNNNAKVRKSAICENTSVRKKDTELQLNGIIAAMLPPGLPKPSTLFIVGLVKLFKNLLISLHKRSTTLTSTVQPVPGGTMLRDIT